MKRYFTILFSALILFAYETKTQSNNKGGLREQSTTINVFIDTLNIPINGDLSHVAWFRNNFYTMFETRRQNTSERFKKMVVFNKKGQVIEDVFLPKEIQDMGYYHLIVNNDSLFVKETQFEKINLVLGEYVSDFALTKTRAFPMFSNEAYNIYLVCNGEFGGTVYFQNKKTKKGYEAASTCPIVINRIDSEYYVTNSASVLKIRDPQKTCKFKSRL